MRNAKVETLRAVGEHIVAYGVLWFGASHLEPVNGNGPWRFNNHQEWQEGLAFLDREYDPSEGAFHGVVVFTDGAWLERGACDESGWWECRKLPSADAVARLGADGRWRT
jgi:hypothetical protein